MTLDADAYRLNFEFIKSYLQDKSEQERYDNIGAIAVMTNVPIIIVATYVAEAFGMTAAILDFRKRLMIFYKIETVLNTKEST